MKKYIFLLLAVLIILNLFTGCVGSPEPEVTRIEDNPQSNNPPPDNPPVESPPADNNPPAENPPTVSPPPQIEEWVVIDHKTRDFGGNLPDWVTSSPLDLEAQSAFEGLYVFIIDQAGKDLQGLQLWARGFIAPSAVARMVSTRVEDKFTGAAAGDMDMLETYMEEVVVSVSEAEFPGLRTVDDFWVKKQNRNNPDQIEFRYLFLVTVPQESVNFAVQSSFDNAVSDNPPKTDEEQAAVNRVQESFEGGL
jgi:hypothetical protein